MPINLSPIIIELQQNEKVSAAWVFGSVASGKDRTDSDLDIAILFIDGIDKQKRFNLRLNISGDLSSIAGREVDVIDMQAAPLFLQHQVRKNGRLLLEKDHAYRVNYDVQSRREYLDFSQHLQTRNRRIINKVIGG